MSIIVFFLQQNFVKLLKLALILHMRNLYCLEFETSVYCSYIYCLFLTCTVCTSMYLFAALSIALISYSYPALLSLAVSLKLFYCSYDISPAFKINIIAIVI